MKEYKKKNNKVFICGLSFNRDNAPWDDDSFDKWTINIGCELFKNIDLCFDMHNWNTSEYKVYYYTEYLTKKKYKFPIVVPEYNENILSDQIIYPQDQVIKQAGMNFRNSFPEAIFYAYLQGYNYIYLFGIDSLEFDKYPDMGHSLYYTIGYVRGKGIKVYFCNDYKMDDDYFYGYQKMTYKDIRE